MAHNQSTLLELQGVSKRYGSFQAVKAVSFQVQKGQLLALIGPNGAGKTTTFNMIGGQLEPSEGKILYQGELLKANDPIFMWRHGIGRTFQIAQCFLSMTVLENVVVALLSVEQQLFKPWKKPSQVIQNQALTLLEWVGLHQLKDLPCSALAYGDVKRLELALALSNQPQLLLMDEPTAGMPEAERHQLMRLIQKLVRQKGLAVLFTEHSMDVVFHYADEVLVLAEGQLIAQGQSKAIQENPQVRAVYLGASQRYFKAQESV